MLGIAGYATEINCKAFWAAPLTGDEVLKNEEKFLLHVRMPIRPNTVPRQALSSCFQLFFANQTGGTVTRLVNEPHLVPVNHIYT